jgi:hypothetical protein
MTRRRHLAAPLAPLAALLLTACASSAAKTPAASSADAAPSSADRPEAALNDLEGQIAALGAAEAQLDRAIRRPPADSVGKDSKKEEQERAPTPGTPMKSGQAGAQKAYRAGADDLAGADPCVTACSALSSMERAARHLCDLTGDGDARCGSARERVAGATERVTASCPACADGR